jgi:hypothetical protein
MNNYIYIHIHSSPERGYRYPTRVIQNLKTLITSLYRISKIFVNKAYTLDMAFSLPNTDIMPFNILPYNTLIFHRLPTLYT